MTRMSKIEWTDVTWNPVAGCTIVSAGCTNCYAMRMAARLEAMGTPKYRGLTRKSGERQVWTGAIVHDEDALGAPLTWRKSRMVFVNSMSDLFHASVELAFIARIWGVMKATPQHTYQVLTKRPERMYEVLSRPDFPVLPNVWLGTSPSYSSHSRDSQTGMVQLPGIA
jgi:protein gp37